MATYIPGSQDYIPQVQPWSPDLNFYQSILERKQSTYDSNWEKLNSIYNSALNAPMMRESNIQRKDEFFKNIQGELKKMASVDLSLPQNVSAASRVFEPFYESEDIIKDIAFTKTFQNEMQLAEGYRRCNTDNCKGKYWEGGVRAMQYHAQDFVNATDDEALRMSNVRYTPYKNLMKMATEAAKDAGISMKVTSKEGQYMVTEKNGRQVQIPLMNFLMATYGDDPELKEFYKTKAYLLTKENPNMANYMYNAALAGFQEQEAQRVAQENYLKDTYENSKNVINSKRVQESNRLQVLNKRKNIILDDTENTKVLPSETDEFFDMIDEINKQETVVKDLDGKSKSISNTDSGIKQNGLTANQHQMEAIIADAMMLQDIQGAAVSLSYRDYERTMEADQFALIATRHANAIQLAQIKNQFDLQKMGLQYKFDKGLAQLKNGVANGSINAGVWSRSGASLMDFPTQQGLKVAGVQPTDQDKADQLATYLAMGVALTDPRSGMNTQSGVIEYLLNNGDFEQAAKIGLSSPGNQETDIKQGTALQEQMENINSGNPDVIISPDTETKSDNNNFTAPAADAKWNNRGNESTFDILYGTKSNPLDDQSTRKGGFNAGKAVVESVLAATRQLKDDSQNYYNTTNIKSLLTRASDLAYGAETERAHVEFTDYGTLIKKNLKKFNISNYKDYQRVSWFPVMPNLTEEEFNLINSVPTNTENTDNLNVEYFGKLSNIGTDKLIMLAGGNDALYNYTEKGSGVFVRNPETGEIMDRNSDAHDLITDQQYSQINNALHAEKVKRMDNPNYVDSSITEEQRIAASKYEVFNENTSFEPKYGAGANRFKNTFTSLQLRGIKQNIQLAEDANKASTKVWNQSLQAAVSDIPMTAGETVGDRLTNVVAKGLVSGDDKSIKSLSSIIQTYDNIAQNLDEIKPERAWFGSEWPTSIAQIENSAKDGLLRTKSTLNLLAVSKTATRDSKINFEKSAPAMLYSISEAKFIKDMNAGGSKGKYSSRKEAVIETLKETPFGAEQFINSAYNTYGITLKDVGELRQINDPRSADPNLIRDVADKVGIVNINAEDQYLPSRQGWLKYLAENSDAFAYERNGNQLILKARDHDNEMVKVGANILGSNELRFDLSSHESKVDDKYASLFTDYQEEIANVYSKAVLNMSTKKSAIGSKFGGKGNLAFSVPNATMLGIDFSKNSQNKADALEVFGSAIERADIEDAFNAEQIKKALTTLYTERNKVYKDPEKAPKFNVYQKFMVDGQNKTQYTVEFTDDKWAKEHGYNKQISMKGKGTVIQNELPSSFTFTVENPQDYMSKNIMPNMFDQILSTLEVDQEYINSANSDAGNLVFRKINDGQVHASIDLKVFDANQGKWVNRRIDGVDLPISGTDFPAQFNLMLNTMNDMYKTSKVLEEQYRDLYGVSGRELMNQQ